jgi:DNA-binding transcriptional regulator YiaG
MKIAKKKVSRGSQIIGGLRSFADSLGKHAIEKKFTVRKYQLRLDPSSYDEKRVKETRSFLGVSQVLFARLLGVSVQAVRSWEQGENTPSKLAARFMDEIRHNPDYWRRRIEESIVVKE